MTELKKGDRVTHAESGFWPDTYTVVGSEGRHTVKVEDGNGNPIRFTVDYLTKVDNEPKVGDRVRLVHEGIVTAVTGIGSGRCLGIDGEARLLGKGETVEVLERAPKAYPVGTVARYKTTGVAYPLLRDLRGGWRNHGGELVSSVTDARVRAGEFEVIYEPASA